MLDGLNVEISLLDGSNVVPRFHWFERSDVISLLDGLNVVTIFNSHWFNCSDEILLQIV